MTASACKALKAFPDKEIHPEHGSDNRSFGSAALHPDHGSKPGRFFQCSGLSKPVKRPSSLRSGQSIVKIPFHPDRHADGHHFRNNNYAKRQNRGSSSLIRIFSGRPRHFPTTRQSFSSNSIFVLIWDENIGSVINAISAVLLFR